MISLLLDVPLEKQLFSSIIPPNFAEHFLFLSVASQYIQGFRGSPANSSHSGGRRAYLKLDSAFAHSPFAANFARRILRTRMFNRDGGTWRNSVWFVGSESDAKRTFKFLVLVVENVVDFLQDFAHVSEHSHTFCQLVVECC